MFLLWCNMYIPSQLNTNSFSLYAKLHYWYQWFCNSLFLSLAFKKKIHIQENDERYQLDATIMIYYHKWLYMFQTSICPSSGLQVVCCGIWCSGLGVVAVVLRSRCVVLCTVCKFASSRIQTHTQCARLHTSSLGPQAQHLVLNTICSSTQPVLLKMGI